MTWGDPEANSSGDYAFAMHGNGDHEYSNADAENYAWHVARSNSTSTTRPRVLTVAPAADIEPGDYHHDSAVSNASRDSVMKEFGLTAVEADEGETFMPEYRSRTGFKVTGHIDTMPGRQGTFPGVNWGNYHARGLNHITAWSANHPVRDTSEKQGPFNFFDEDGPLVKESPGATPMRQFDTTEEGERFLQERADQRQARNEEGLFPVTDRLTAGRGARHSDFFGYSPAM